MTSISRPVPPLVSLYQDVEDPLNPLADDAALDLARLFTDAGVRGSFCVTGEKCRVLLARGRQDVLEALLPHCLGLHTDTHSYHPTTMELLADLGFDEGVEAACRTEKRGYDSFVEAFGRPPAFWGGAGNTWSPEITEALKRLGIPVYAYALTELPDQAPHRFNGVRAFAQELWISETDWADDGRAQARGDAVIENLRSSARPYRGIFTGHPTKFRYARFWDEPYAGGRTPGHPELAEPLPGETYERSKRNLSAFIERLKREATVIGVDEAIVLPWRFRTPSEAERRYFEERTTRNIRRAAEWPIHHPSLDPQRIVAKTLALVNTVEVGELPEGSVTEGAARTTPLPKN